METSIIDSWQTNANEWIKIIENQKIESRIHSNKAIESVVKEMPEKKILDVGCGEGWLTRSMTKMGKEVTGVDAIEVLLVYAQSKTTGSETFFTMSYKEIVDGKQVPNSPFEVAIFNFCLYEKDNLIELFQATRNLLNQEGKILIQTLHPYFMTKNNLEYKSQILFDSFKGLPGNFSKSHEWYARTIEDWVSLILDAKMNILEMKEVVNDQKTPISLILKIS